MPTPTEVAAVFAGLPSPESFAKALELPAAHPGSLHNLPREELGVIAARSREHLVAGALTDLPAQRKGGPTRREASLGVASLGIVFTSHYVAAMEALIEVEDEFLGAGVVWPSTLEKLTDRWKQLEPRCDPDTAGYEPVLAVQAFLAVIARSVITAWMLSAGIRHKRTKRTAGASSWPELRGGAVEATMILWEVALLPREGEDGIALLPMLMDIVAPPTSSAVIRALRDEDPPLGSLEYGHAALQVNEIPYLASRIYGIGAAFGMPIERALERQLALLFTSLGFAVIEGRPGKRHVDLICVARASEPATVVIEAKSTRAREYKFVADEQRALIEHVQSVQRTLRGLPRIRLVLLVAPAFSSGAVRRLEEANKALGIPCHAVPAALLADLRRRHIGEIESDALIETIRSGPCLVDEAIVERVLKAANAENEGWKAFADVVRAARES